MVAGGSGVDIAPIGIVLAILCALTYTGYLIGVDRVVHRTNPLTTATWLAAGASVANLTYAIIFHGWSTPHGSVAGLRVFGMGAFTAGAFVCMIASLHRIGAVRNAIIGVLEPLTVAVLAAAPAGRADLDLDGRRRRADPARGRHRDARSRRARGRAGSLTPR